MSHPLHCFREQNGYRPNPNPMAQGVRPPVQSNPIPGNTMNVTSAQAAPPQNRNYSMGEANNMTQMSGMRYGSTGNMGPVSQTPGMPQPPYQNNNNYGLNMSSPPHGSPGMSSNQPNLMMSPRNRGSPKMGSSQFSPIPGTSILSMCTMWHKSAPLVRKCSVSLFFLKGIVQGKCKNYNWPPH